jgi:hypothetical protein
MRAIDIVGNKSDWSTPQKVIIDRAYPVVTNDFVLSGVAAGEVSLQWKGATDAGSGICQANVVDEDGLILATSSAKNAPVLKVAAGAKLVGTAQDITYTSSAYFGILVRYSNTYRQKYYADNIYVGPIIVDNVAPIVQAIKVLSANSLELQFSESVSQITAEETANYLVNNGIGEPVSAVRSTSSFSRVILSFIANFQEGIENILTITAVEDLSGNDMNPQQVPFLYYRAKPYDVVINEIMADPTPTQGSPAVEYLEIRNNTSNTLDLSDVRINAGTFNSSVTIQPNSFLIIADSENSSAFDASLPTAFMDGFPSLTNSGLELNLYNGSTLLDRVSYAIDWYRDEVKADGGWTLERINPLAVCSGRYNWRASNATTGSTLGAENSVYSAAPNGVPIVVDYGALNDSTIYILFSESLDTLSALALSGDMGNGVLAINPTWNSDRDLLTLSTSTPMVAELTYTLSLVGLTDCDGNASAAPSLSFIRGVEAGAGDIIINEIMADGSNGDQTASPSVDFIEIFNRTNRLIDLTNLKVNNGFFGSQVLLQPDSFLIITDSDSDPLQFFAYPNVAFMDGFPALT